MRKEIMYKMSIRTNHAHGGVLQILLTVFVIFVCAVNTLLAAVEISNLKIQQRYPWNGKVDIEFSLASTRAYNSIRINMFDTVTGNDWVAATVYDRTGGRLNAPFKLGPGKHHLIWDAEMDVPKGFKRDSVAISLTAGPYVDRPLYLVVDLSNATTVDQLPMYALNEIPTEGWTEEYHRTKMVFRLVQAGTFIEGPNPGFISAAGMSDVGASRRVTITKPFYLGVFPVTCAQWDRVMGITNPSDSILPQSQISPLNLRGTIGKAFPDTWDVDSDSFVGKIRSRTRYDWFDLPSEAQWEYACRAGTTTIYSTGHDILTESIVKKLMTEPNAWGFYYMTFGSETKPGSAEICLGWFEAQYGTDPVIDPLGNTFASSHGTYPVRGFWGGYSPLEQVGRGSNERMGQDSWDRIDGRFHLRMAIWCDRD